MNVYALTVHSERLNSPPLTFSFLFTGVAVAGDRSSVLCQEEGNIRQNLRRLRCKSSQRSLFSWAKKRWIETASSDSEVVSSWHQRGQEKPTITPQSTTENMKVWVNSLQLVIGKMKDEEKWPNNYISIHSIKIKGEKRLYSSHSPKNPVSKKTPPKDKSNWTDNVPQSCLTARASEMTQWGESTCCASHPGRTEPTQQWPTDPYHVPWQEHTPPSPYPWCSYTRIVKGKF